MRQIKGFSTTAMWLCCLSTAAALSGCNGPRAQPVSQQPHGDEEVTLGSVQGASHLCDTEVPDPMFDDTVNPLACYLSTCSPQQVCVNPEWGDCWSKERFCSFPVSCKATLPFEVCGCDGKDYPNACAAINFGGGVAHTSPCCCEPALNCEPWEIAIDETGDGCPERCEPAP